MAAVTVTITKAVCDHITIKAFVDGVEKKSISLTLTKLKELMGDIDNEDMLLSQIRKIIGENPNATMSQLKQKIEAETYYV